MLLEGWGTDDRRLLLHLVHAIDAQMARDRVDRTPSIPELLRARVEMIAYIKRGTTGTTSAELSGTQSVPPGGAFVMLTVEATSSTLDISDSLVRRHCRNGTLTAIKVRGAWQVDRESVEQRRREKERTIE